MLLDKNNKLPRDKIDCVIFSALVEEMLYIKNAFTKLPFTIILFENFEFKIYEYKNLKILLVYTGVGTTFAASIFTWIYTHCNPSYALVTGTAGGVNEEVGLNNVVIGENAFEAEMQAIIEKVKGTPFEDAFNHPLLEKYSPMVYPANPFLLSLAKKIQLPGIKIHIGSIATSNAFPSPLELYNEIKEKNALAIDMETSAFYQIAWLFGIKVLAIRGISNILNAQGNDENLEQAEVKDSTEAAGKIVLKLLDELAKHPNLLIKEYD